MEDELVIEDLTVEQLGELEPLWDALRAHHVSVAAKWLGEPRTRSESWRRRRGQYQSWLEEEDAFVVVARRQETLVGYAVIRMRDGSPTWSVSERAGEVETLSVAPEERREGVGERLMDAVCERLRARGAQELSLHVLEGNEDAMRFYARQGFRRFAVWLSRPL